MPVVYGSYHSEMFNNHECKLNAKIPSVIMAFLLGTCAWARTDTGEKFFTVHRANEWARASHLDDVIQVLAASNMSIANIFLHSQFLPFGAKRIFVCINRLAFLFSHMTVFAGFALAVPAVLPSLSQYFLNRVRWICWCFTFTEAYMHLFCCRRIVNGVCTVLVVCCWFLLLLCATFCHCFSYSVHLHLSFISFHFSL